MKINSWDETAEQYLEAMGDPSKVGVVTDAAGKGSGIGRVARNLAQKFVEKDVETVLYAVESNIDGENHEMLENTGVEVKTIEQETGWRKIKDLKRIAKIFEEDDLDYINAHGFYLSLAAVYSSVPVAKTYHAHITVLYEIRKHPFNWLKWTVQDGISNYYAEKRIAISRYAQKQMKKFYRLNSQVIYNGIDKDRFQEKEETDFREKHDIPEDAYVVGSLSALKKYKNQRQTLQIFKEEYNKGNQYLLIGGDGPQRQHLEQKAEELGIQDKTKFLGYIPDEELVDFYNAIDLFIYPSKWEGFGLPPVEAKSSGCKIKVVTNKTALKELKMGFE